MKTTCFIKTALISTLGGMLLASCGGGGSSSSFSPPVVVTPPPPPPTSTDPTWTAGVFQNESNFEARCENPRTGSSRFTGNPYPDRAGSTVFEKFWLRSWSNDKYLWYSELPDINPDNGDTRLEYFDRLRTTRTTASGNPVDQFHFTIPTDEYEQSVTSGSSAGYGARFRLIQSAPPRNIRVAYVENGSPAETAGFSRGDRILEIDGEDAVNGNNVTVLNNGLFPADENEQHTFLIRRVDGTETTISATSAIVASDPVLLTKVVDGANGEKIAYIVFNTFGTSIAEEALFDAFTSLESQGITDVVLDLRYNGGGFLAISSQLGYMLAGDANVDGHIYEELVFNDKYPTVNPVTGQTLSPTPFYKEGLDFSIAEGTPLPTLNLSKVYVLSTSSTCSASESLINAMEGIDVEVVLIGTTTCGKPYGFYATDNCGETYFTIQFRGENDKGFGDYADGFSPTEGATTVGEPIEGCVVDDDFSKQLGDEDENMLETAINHIKEGKCPTTLTAQTEKSWGVELDTDQTFSLMNDPRVQRRLFLEQNRILNVPGE